MAPSPIIFALANPDPEIRYDEARCATRRHRRHRTQRLPEPGQQRARVPLHLPGALDVRATAMNEEMKMAAANALALLAKEPVPVAAL